jgi:hypothetical protein
MTQVLDYSAGFPGAARIKAAGYAGAVRYIGFPTRGKCTTAAELRDFNAQGLGMALVYEDKADDWRGGLVRGRDAGVRARAHADAISFPKDRPIYMAIDQDVVTEAEFRTMLAYLDGANDRLGGPDLTGVYGEHDVMVRAQSAGVAKWWWQTRAWSGTPVKLFAARHLYQHVGTVRVGGIDCDFNDVLRADWGQHLLEDDMLTPDQAKQLDYNTKVGVETQRRVTLMRAELSALAKVVAADKDIDPAELARIVDAAVAEHTPSAVEIAEASQSAITAAVAEALGEDNADLAADIVRRLGEKLGAA